MELKQRMCLRCRVGFVPETKFFFCCPKCRANNLSTKTAKTMRKLVRRKGGETRSA